jgi:hypothetical protein
MDIVRHKKSDGMLRYVLDRVENGIAHYPEHDEVPGIVSVNKENGEIEIVELSPDDKSRIYAFKLVRRLEKFCKENIYWTKAL